MSIKYEDSKIYKIVCNVTGLVYVGATTKQYLSQRLAAHVACYNHFKKGNVSRYMTSAKILEGGNYDIHLLELCPCGSIDEQKIRERYYIELLECVNKVIPGRTSNEYYNDFKEKYNATHKSYYDTNKEMLLKTINCECGGKYCYQKIRRHFISKKHKKYLSNLRFDIDKLNINN